jgi:hypothetical protein
VTVSDKSESDSDDDDEDAWENIQSKPSEEVAIQKVIPIKRSLMD